ncbi:MULTISPECIES: hypothetical protein [Cyanophyceae]|nr:MULTISPECIES: hypothetical protein [Cyanophyceae]
MNLILLRSAKILPDAGGLKLCDRKKRKSGCNPSQWCSTLP